MINEIQSADQLDELFTRSSSVPVLLFKHSVTCPISLNVYESISGAPFEVNLVVVQTARPVSIRIAERTGVRHESPQALILRDGKAIYSASHYDITLEDISRHFA